MWMEIGPEQRPELSLEWGNELLRNLEGFEDFHSKLVDQITSPPFNKPNILVIAGRSMAGKDEVATQESEEIKANDQVKHAEAKSGEKLSIRDVPFASSALAAQVSGRIPQTVKEGRKVVAHRKYETWEYTEISALQDEVAEYGVNELSGPRLLIVKPSTFTVFFPPDRPLVGNDRGLSVVDRLAADPNTRKFMHLLLLLRDKKILEKAMPYRERLLSVLPEEIPDILAEADIQIFLKTRPSRQKEKVVERLSKEQLEMLAGRLFRMMAPPETVRRSDHEQEEVIEALFKLGIISERSERAYHEYLADRWKIENTLIVENPYRSGENNYFLGEGNDLVAEVYPQIKDLVI